MLNGLDLFSGIGGITLGLAPWVNPIAYCEQDRYCQGVLLSRMCEGALPVAPIWDDVRTLTGSLFYSWPDIIYGGFPCQDISVAGNGAGLAGKRSGLFYEITRLIGELRPTFIFLENVPAITTRGGREVVGALTALGYDSRWCVISAAEVGANHKRERWFLLAHANGSRKLQQNGAFPEFWKRAGYSGQIVADTQCTGLQRQGSTQSKRWVFTESHSNFSSEWWTVEPSLGRVAHGIPFRVDRIKGLGNAVVPLQARTAFEILSGLRGLD